MQVDGELARFTNGMVLRLAPEMISADAVLDAARSIPLPAVPTPFVESLGREEPNPEDPDYIDARDRAMRAKSWAAIQAVLILGTELVEPPANTRMPEDIDWNRVAVATGERIPDEPLKRYAVWLKLYGFKGMAAEAESAALIARLFLDAGLTQEGAALSVATFRPDAKRGADRDGGGDAPHPNGTRDRGAKTRAAPRGR